MCTLIKFALFKGSVHVADIRNRALLMKIEI